MILIEYPPRRYGKKRRWSHMISDKPGDAGGVELKEFALKIGLRSEWLQDAGTDREHFDVYSRPIMQRALREGARPVGSRDIVRAIRAKQEVG